MPRVLKITNLNAHLLRIFLLKMQEEWRIAPENDDFILKLPRILLVVYIFRK